MNKPEQAFATKLKNWLLKTKPAYSMAVEVKVATGQSFAIGDIRKSQWATLLKLSEGIPVAHKISDGKAGSKLVDLLYLNPDAVRIIPMIAIKFMDSKKCYLVDFNHFKKAKADGHKSIKEVWFQNCIIKM
jgi:hypothetical protein